MYLIEIKVDAAQLGRRERDMREKSVAISNIQEEIGEARTE